MPSSPQSTHQEKRLIRRYLLWCYKTTKEALEKIDRKFTQLQVDHYIWDHLTKDRKFKPVQANEEYRAFTNAFKKYIEDKERQAYLNKFADKDHRQLKAEYHYLKNRLSCIEEAAVYFLGKAGMKRIEMLYEEEMIRRIIESREHT